MWLDNIYVVNRRKQVSAHGDTCRHKMASIGKASSLKHHYYFTINISAHCGWIRFNEIMKTNNNSLYVSSLFAVDSDVYNAVSSKEKE